jgi:hypothetical protein
MLDFIIQEQKLHFLGKWNKVQAGEDTSAGGKCTHERKTGKMGEVRLNRCRDPGPEPADG